MTLIIEMYSMDYITKSGTKEVGLLDSKEEAKEYLNKMLERHNETLKSTEVYGRITVYYTHQNTRYLVSRV